MNHLHRLSLLLSLTLGLSACTNNPFLYRPDIIQGNVYQNSTIDRLHLGMSREDVHRLLGSPALTDPFTPNIDLYLYHYRIGDNRHLYQGNTTIYYNAQNLITHIEKTPISRQP